MIYACGGNFLTEVPPHTFVKFNLRIHLSNDIFLKLQLDVDFIILL